MKTSQKAEILTNQQIAEDTYLMQVKAADQPAMGQFYMLRSWDTEPVLSRPISVYDADGKTLSFLYHVIGRGTGEFSRLKPGASLELLGPLGHGFPVSEGRIALVGGGIGIAPLYLCAKQLKQAHPDAAVDCYLGFRDHPFLQDEFSAAADRCTINVGGFVTDDIDPMAYDCIMACGPIIMMKVLYQKCCRLHAAAKVYVSMESRMACGIGVCMCCSVKTSTGNRRVCRDGPVMLASEVFCDE